MNQTDDPLRYIRKNFDWEAYVYDNFDTKSGRGDEIRICCPSCEETNYKCYVNPVRRVFNCFKCTFGSRKYDAIHFVKVTEGIPKVQAIKNILTNLQVTTPTGEALEEAVRDLTYNPGTNSPTRKMIRSITDLPGTLLVDEKSPAFKYLLGRGLTSEDITDMGTRFVEPKWFYIYDKNDPKKKWNIGRRIIWPVYGGDNDLVSWTAREFETKSKMKYLNCPDSDMGLTLWPYCRPLSSDVVLVEGKLDAVALRRVPGVSAYATMGKKVSDEQMDLLKMWDVKSVTLFWDKKDAKKEIISNVEHLKLQFQTFVASQHNLDKNQDCGDFLNVKMGRFILEEAMTPIDVYSLDYDRWQIE